MPLTLKPFQTELPHWTPLKPLLASPTHEDWYAIDVSGPFPHYFHPDASAVAVWGYNAHHPGPLIIAHQNRPVQITWTNKLGRVLKL